MSFELIEAKSAHYPMALMCRALGLSRSGLHAYRTRKPSARAQAQHQRDVAVRAVFTEHRGRYGSPRVHRVLQRRGLRTGHNQVADSMARQGLEARPKRRWRKTTDSQHQKPIAPNPLQRSFTVATPARVWVADTTYLPVIGGFIFLVVVLDLFSRKGVGWALGDRLDSDLACLALRRALVRRSPLPGLIFHTDRGSEFAADAFRAILRETGSADSFFSTLEFERPATTTWRTVEDAEPAIFTFIEAYYNSTRFYSHSGCRSPIETETDLREVAQAAQPRCPRNRGKLTAGVPCGHS